MENLRIKKRDVFVNMSIGNQQSLQEIQCIKDKLDLPMLKKRVLWVFHRQCPPKGEYKFEIKVLSCDGLILTGAPVLCEMNNGRPKASGEFEIDGIEIPFRLFFNPAAIYDCNKILTEDRHFELTFNLLITDPSDDNKMVLEVQDSLTVTVQHFDAHLQFEFQANSLNDHLVYSKSDINIKIGNLHITHNAHDVKQTCIPLLKNIRFKVYSVLPGGDDLNTSDKVLRLSPNDNGTQICKIDGGSEVSISELKAGQSIDLPVEWNMSAIDNPQGDSDVYPIIAKQEGREPQKIEEQHLYRNRTLTRFMATISMPQLKGKPLVKDISWSDVDPNLGNLLLSSDQKTTITMLFQNLADADDRQHPDASVLLWGMKIEEITVDANSNGLILQEGKSLSDLVTINVDEKQWWTLNHRNGTCREILLTVWGSALKAIIPDAEKQETFVDLHVKLEYHVKNDPLGIYYDDVSKGQMSQEDGLCHQVIKIRLMRKPQEEWLCVDFGTSAVVAAYAQSLLYEDEAIIDLKRQKKQLLDKVFIGDEKSLITVDDEKDNLIASTIFFNNLEREQCDCMYVSPTPEAYKNYALWFSPSANAVYQEYQLPCLKTIIGYEHIPDIFSGNAKKIEYYQFDNTSEHNLVAKQLYDGNQVTMTVDMVSQIVYRQLFCHYLSERLDDKGNPETRPFNKLVLSVPNTYTPINTKAVIKLAREAMPSLYPEYLYTVSESDAVACYYLSHAKKFYEESHDLDSGLLESLAKNENVLVYDMGAGTLDLTWFTKKCDTMGNTVMAVKGKMGVNKAGNYLDYVLAGIVVSLYANKLTTKQQNKDKLLQTMKMALDLNIESSIKNNFDSRNRKALKDYVKALKRCLDQKDQLLTNLTVDGQPLNLIIDGLPIDLVDCKICDILQHPDFQQFLNDITKKVLDVFALRFGENGKLNVDVLVFSGRSTSLKAIREAVGQHMENVRSNVEQKLLYADICGKRLSYDVEQQAGDNSQLKTVVTFGALAYANYQRQSDKFKIVREPFYATYGVVLRSSSDGDVWVPLIGKNVEGMTETNGTYESRSVEIPSNVDCIDLIQSYSANVEDDYKNHNFETISKLSELSNDGNLQVQLIYRYSSLEDNSESVITFKRGLQDDGVELNPHDDFNNETLRKSLWPLIFVQKKKRFK